MTKILVVSRHPATVEFVKGTLTLNDQVTVVSHYLPQMAEGYDQVVGVLPIQLVEELCNRGKRFLQVVMDVPEEFRGKELSLDQMKEFNGRLVEYHVKIVKKRKGTMKIIANIDDRDFRCCAGDQIECDENLYYLVSTSTEEEDRCEFMLVDPLIDGLIFYRHENAPWSETAGIVAQSLAHVLYNFDQTEPKLKHPLKGGEFMIRCWKDFQGCVVGRKYIAELDKNFAYGPSNFHIKELYTRREISFVDNVLDVIKHFVLDGGEYYNNYMVEECTEECDEKMPVCR